MKTNDAVRGQKQKKIPNTESESGVRSGQTTTTQCDGDVQGGWKEDRERWEAEEDTENQKRKRCTKRVDKENIG